MKNYAEYDNLVGWLSYQILHSVPFKKLPKKLQKKGIDPMEVIMYAYNAQRKLLGLPVDKNFKL